jgi:hypothetical protein
MMRRWSFYRLSDGAFTGQCLMSSQDALAGNTPPGCAALEGNYDHRSQRVDLQTGTVVDDAALAEENRRSREQQQRRDHATLSIAELERRQLRPTRELQIDPTNAEARSRLEAIETQIAGLRTSLEG